MSDLQKDALGVQVMSPDAVGCIRDAARDMTKEHLVDVVRRMAKSHERLRMELNGAEVVLDELHQQNRQPQKALIIHPNHAKCIEALQQIALLGDTGSNEYRKRFYDTVMSDVGWRVAEAMREVANDVVGDMPLSPIFDEPHTASRG